MTAISPADGPVAVTGASGYIGSWIVHDLMQQGYRVHACVQDLSNPAEVDHITALNEDPDLRGQVKLFRGELFDRGSYDEAFAGCSGVIHAAATVAAARGEGGATPQEVYDGCFTENDHVLASARKSRTLKRFIFTSSGAAVGHPRPDGYVFTEKDWCGDNIEAYRGRWTEDRVPESRGLAYGMAKANTERMIYRTAKEDGSFDAMAILPFHVVGPLMCVDHDQLQSQQQGIRFMMSGKLYGGNRLWNIVDVRDVGRAHRLAAESTRAMNGSRYILSAKDRSGELFTWQLQQRLHALYPAARKGVEEMVADRPAEQTHDSPRAYCLLAMEELGLQSHRVDETLRATVDSYYRLGLIPA
jgi:nucleoside-diphosphate-sugar epimerase